MVTASPIIVIVIKRHYLISNERWIKRVTSLCNAKALARLFICTPFSYPSFPRHLFYAMAAQLYKTDSGRLFHAGAIAIVTVGYVMGELTIEFGGKTKRDSRSD